MESLINDNLNASPTPYDGRLGGEVGEFEAAGCKRPVNKSSKKHAPFDCGCKQEMERGKRADFCSSKPGLTHSRRGDFVIAEGNLLPFSSREWAHILIAYREPGSLVL